MNKNHHGLNLFDEKKSDKCMDFTTSGDLSAAAILIINLVHMECRNDLGITAKRVY